MGGLPLSDWRHFAKYRSTNSLATHAPLHDPLDVPGIYMSLRASRRLLIAVGCGLMCLGCATTRTSDTARTGIEQLLISNAVDHSLAKIDFSPLNGQKVFVQEKYLDGVDKNYVAGTIRHRVLAAGAKLAEKQEDADIVMELRSGGIGTDRQESFIGIPQVAAPGPFPLQIPEVQLITTKTQTATAKIGIVAYDAKTNQAIGNGGMSLARSEDSNLFVFGVGPFNRGHVKEEVITATGQGGAAFELARYIPLAPLTPDEPLTAPVNFTVPDPPASTAPFPALDPPGMGGYP